MPDHLHAPIGFSNNSKNINTVIENGKRFIGYELVDRLKKGKYDKVLKSLSSWVNATDRNRKKKRFFEPSFDGKECNSESLVEQKLNYIHENAIRGEGRLVENPEDYEALPLQYPDT